MKKSYEVRWSETSENDLVAIVHYIADDSPLQAYEIFKGIKYKAPSLRTYPHRGRIVPELLGQGKDVRDILHSSCQALIPVPCNINALPISAFLRTHLSCQLCYP